MYDNMEELIAEYDALILDTNDIDFDERTGIAKVNKEVFDCFMENYYIDIYCPDINANYIIQFKMISEDEDTITMEWLDKIRI